MSRVLLVDDDEDIVEGMRAVLQAFLPEVEVVAARSGPDALQILDRQPPDVLVTDYRMPGMDGLELARRVRAGRPHMPVILVTAFGGTGLEEQAARLGVDAFIHKPFRPAELAQAVAATLAS